ncbi:hypothetical protein [uncultured Methanobrevibacter sp.]|uniref:hypothetical protein n=1 Tax=uncultured Methanobrevibacter sp. TaxID=253161 RepID=UPI0025F78E04|nr:hypothetical protein [uncultured Methanobrevibacter sp.]
MNVKKVFLIVLISLMLISTAYAAKSVNDFTVDKSYESVYKGNYYSLYLNKNQDSGIGIYKNVDDDIIDDADNDDIYENIIHDDGREYISADEDMQLTSNSDNTSHFKDMDKSTHGISEIVKSDGEEFIVIVFAKDGSNVSDSDLTKLLNGFNKDNNLSPITS